MSTDPRIDAYIAKSAEFAQPILTRLRAIVHLACPKTEETIRWSMPSFSYAGRPLASMAAFKRHCSFGLWGTNTLARGREGEALGQLGRIESLADLPVEGVVEQAIAAAIAMADAGHRAHRPPRAAKAEAVVPPALAAALARDETAAATYAALPPSCRRDYCDWIAEAKRDATRDKRVAEALTMLREGKRRNWKYEKC